MVCGHLLPPPLIGSYGESRRGVDSDWLVLSATRPLLVVERSTGGSAGRAARYAWLPRPAASLLPSQWFVVGVGEGEYTVRFYTNRVQQDPGLHLLQGELATSTKWEIYQWFMMKMKRSPVEAIPDSLRMSAIPESHKRGSTFQFFRFGSKCLVTLYHTQLWIFKSFMCTFSGKILLSWKWIYVILRYDINYRNGKITSRNAIIIGAVI